MTFCRFGDKNFSAVLTGFISLFSLNLLVLRKESEDIERLRNQAFCFQSALATGTIGTSLIWLWTKVTQDPEFYYDPDLSSYEVFVWQLWTIVACLVANLIFTCMQLLCNVTKSPGIKKGLILLDQLACLSIKMKQSLTQLMFKLIIPKNN